MRFEEVLEKLNTRLKKLAAVKARGSFLDKDELYQEMCVYLWEAISRGEYEGKSPSYIATGCKYHLANYIRKHADRFKSISLDKAAGDDEHMPFSELLAQEERLPDEKIDTDIVIEYVNNNGFTKREKEVFYLLIEGETVRDIGRRLDISHVAVVKIRKKLIGECRKKLN